jgi:class 3 adenylate cyclase
MATQTATILVSDVVGSTDLRVRLGEDAAEELRRIHDRLVRLAVEANGGWVVKGLEDGVLALFAGAADALAAGVAIQQQADLHGRRCPDASLVMRVGVSVGDVNLEDEDCFGTPVTEASRLYAQAEGGGILAAELGDGHRPWNASVERHIRRLNLTKRACMTHGHLPAVLGKGSIGGGVV